MNEPAQPYRLRDRLRPRFKTQVVEDDFPTKLRPRTLYVLKEEDVAWAVGMTCPCGCGASLHMNLLPDQRPRWRLFMHADGTGSLNPSIWRENRCGSHFWFRAGRVFWTYDQPYQLWRDVRLWLRR